IDRISKDGFGIGFELLEYQAGDLFWSEQSLTDFQQRPAALRFDDERELFLLRFSRSASDQAFDGIDRALREECTHPIRGSTDYRIAGFREINHGRRQPGSISVSDQDWKAGIHHPDQGVRCSEINPDDITHKLINFAEIISIGR